jgi:hypothetical protein
MSTLCWDNREYFFLLCVLTAICKIRINKIRPSHAGDCIILRIAYRVWFPMSVRYASVCRLQSAREAQSSAVGYHTVTRLYRLRLWRIQLSSSSAFRATYRHFGARVSSYGETTKRLHTSPPEHTTVWSLVKVYSISMPFTLPDEKIILYSFQIYGYSWRHNESSTLWTISDLFLSDMFRRCLHRDGKYFIIIYNKINDVYF